MFGLIIIISIISYQGAETITDNLYLQIVLLILYSLFISSLICLIYDVCMQKRQENTKKVKSGIRKDLYFRTSNLDVKDMDELEVRRKCESLYNCYITCYNKSMDIQKIEYSNLYGIYQDSWYKKAANKTKIFAFGNFIIQLIVIFTEFKTVAICSLILSGCFWLIIYFLKKKKKLFLNRIAICYCLNEWGYCLFERDKIEFVGDIELFDISKYKKFVYAFLDIAAFSRALATTYEKSGGKMIQVLSDNLLELGNDYPAENETWISWIPLWIAALFEFCVSKELSEAVRKKLKSFIINGEIRKDVSIFLAGFWVHMRGRTPDEENCLLLKSFLDYLSI